MNILYLCHRFPFPPKREFARKLYLRPILKRGWDQVCNVTQDYPREIQERTETVYDND